ncbi:DUF3160 domain-containing protein [Treponema phagedenis]|uniref:DUF3160 domain-containing protein n=1 Tax=Treponema phagedenis TaxID=162 RepID=UPI002467C099|nr:DUF3160 domain-containing protein [Treponema phagedenis]
MIELAPKKTEAEDESGRSYTKYVDPNKAGVLAKYPKAVQDEIKLMEAAQGQAPSSVFTFADSSAAEEDYSQYTVRGHYTKNGILATYFKVMMWFGRAHFLIADNAAKVLPVGEKTASDAIALTANMQPIALLITEVINKNPSLYTQWQNIFDPITALIGLSDDLSFYEVLPIWKEFNVNDFGAWSSDKKNLHDFMKKAHEKCAPPAIAGLSVLYAAAEEDSEGNNKQPMGWRLFGQRFTYDSFIHHLVSSPRLYGRQMVSGMDIMKAFGSKAADGFLAEDYKRFPAMQPILNSLAEEISADPGRAFGKTYYGSVLNEIATQARFEQGSGFYFTESPAWTVKALNSAHGSWAELRHDTILYVKQSYAKMGGGAYEPTFRTEPIPKMIHYIEPNLAFWKNAVNSTKLLTALFKHFNMIQEYDLQKLQELTDLCVKASEIVELEIKDKPVSAEDNIWISTIPRKLSHVILVGIDSAGDGAYFDNDDMVKMALVADVFTNAETNTVLETAVGTPYRIYVPLNDGQGGKRIAVGYCFNYYEFPHPISDRLTDEKWKERVYADPAENLEDLKPEWSRGTALPAEGSF